MAPCAENLNNQGIWLANCQNLLGKIDFLFSSIRKSRFSDPEKPEKSISVLKVFGKIDFQYSGEVTHPTSAYRNDQTSEALCMIFDYVLVSFQG